MSERKFDISDLKLHEQPDIARRRSLLATSNEDQTGYLSIILGGAFVEHYVRAAVYAELEYADRFMLTSDGSEYHHDYAILLKLIYALNSIDEPTYKLFKAFSQLRNRFAHGIDETLTSSENQKRLLEILRLCSPRTDTEKALRDETLAFLKKAHSKKSLVDEERMTAVSVLAIRLIVSSITEQALRVHSDIADYIIKKAKELGFLGESGAEV